MNSIIQNKFVLHVLFYKSLKSNFSINMHIFKKKLLLIEVSIIIGLTEMTSLRCSLHVSGQEESQSKGIS